MSTLLGSHLSSLPLHRVTAHTTNSACRSPCITLHLVSRGSGRAPKGVCRSLSANSIDLGSRSTVTYINRPVRADEHVEAPGSVVVHGDVAADASISAAGDVMVWGRLSGHVHAGCAGDRSAVISALELRGASLVIAHSTSLGAARITVPGPHTAHVLQAGRNLTMNLTPLGPAHPALNPIGLTSSIKRWFAFYPAAAAALFTGCYALLAGLALMLAPNTVLGLLFDASAVPAAWIRVGGVLFGTFGAQYLGTAIADYRQVLAASRSSSGCPDMPFRPASPQPGAPQQQQQQQHARPAALAAVAATYTQPHSAAAGVGGLAGTAAAMLHDSSSAYVNFGSSSTSSSSDGAGSSSSCVSADGCGPSDGGSSSSSTSSSSSSSSSSSCGSSRPVGRSVPADQLTKDQVEQLRETHKLRHKAAAAAAAAAVGSSGADAGSGGRWEAAGGVHHSGKDYQADHNQQAQGQHQQQQQQQQQPPPTWAYCSSGFYEASVWARLALAAAFAVLVAVGQGPPGLLVLALVNVLGALSMWGALRRQWLMHVMGDMPELAGAQASAS